MLIRAIQVSSLRAANCRNLRQWAPYGGIFIIELIELKDDKRSARQKPNALQGDGSYTILNPMVCQRGMQPETHHFHVGQVFFWNLPAPTYKVNCAHQGISVGYISLVCFPCWIRAKVFLITSSVINQFRWILHIVRYMLQTIKIYLPIPYL